MGNDGGQRQWATMVGNNRGQQQGATTGGDCQNLVLKSKILSKRSGKSVDKFQGLEWSAPKSNPSGSGKPIVEGVGLKMQPAEMQAVPFRGLA